MPGVDVEERDGVLVGVDLPRHRPGDDAAEQAARVRLGGDRLGGGRDGVGHRRCSPVARRRRSAVAGRRPDGRPRGRRRSWRRPWRGDHNTPGVRQSGWSAGSGSGSVTSSAARIRPSAVGDQRVRVPRTTAGHIDQQGIVGQQGRLEAGDESFGVRRVRGDDDHDIASGSGASSSEIACTSGGRTGPIGPPG